MRKAIYIFVSLLILVIIVLILGQSTFFQSEEGEMINAVSSKEISLIQLNKFSALPQNVKTPVDNTTSTEKVELGRLLFYDPILSGDKDVACATCHHPKSGYAEYRDLSIGVNGKGLGAKRHFKQPNTIPFVKRNAHTVLNTAFNGIGTASSYNPSKAPMFWDLRVESLESQAIEPILAFEEMRGTHFSESQIIDSF